MSKINKKSRNYGLKILAIFVFGLIFIPLNTTMAAYGSNVSDYFTGYRKVNNPVPGVSAISPSSNDRGVGAKTVTITGEDFIPNSVARLNGSNRPTTFIDHSHLLIQLSANDMYMNDGFFISVFNEAPEGGYSNAIFFTLNKAFVTNTNSNTVNNNSNTTTTTDNTNTYSNTNQTQDSNETGSSLASSVILGSNTFLPSGLIGWIFLAIIILIIVILVRRVFGAEEKYHASPMKHS